MPLRKAAGWLVVMLLAVLAPAARPLAAQPAASPAVEPRIVVQAISEAGIDVAAWSPDGRFIWTASGFGRELLLWDAKRGIIIDGLRLPSPPGATADVMRLTRMAMAPDGRSLTIDGEVMDVQSQANIAGRRYVVNTASRRISIAPPPPVAAGRTADKAALDWINALSAIYAGGEDMTRAAAEQILPRLPAAPDGRTRMVRAGTGFGLVGPDGKVRLPRVTDHTSSIADAELSPDERILAVLTMNEEFSAKGGDAIQSVQLLDLASGRMLPRVEAAGDFDRLRWIDNERFAVFESDDQDDPLSDATEGELSQMAIYKASTGTLLARVPGRCFTAMLPDGRFIGAGLANCRRGVPPARGLELLAGDRWQPLPGPAIARDAHVRVLAVSPTGDRYVYGVRLANGANRIQIVDLATGAAGPSLGLDDTAILTMISFAPDGRRLWIAGNGTLAEWQIDAPPAADGTPALRELPGLVLMPQRMAGDGRWLMVGGALEERIQMIDLADDRGSRTVEFPGSAAVGLMRGRPVQWAASITEGIRLWDRRNGRVLVSIRLLPGGRFVAVAPDGRYDTNMGPDSENFRWLVTDRPWESLAPQTLMRDYYEPRLIAKLMDCARAGNCASALHPVPPVAGLNRQLPQVAVTAVRATEPGLAEVDVVASETIDPQTRTPSGVFGIKLLMNNREIARDPDDPAAGPADLAAWQTANATEPGDDKGNRYWTFTVPIPTDGKPIRFSAYSFNSARVKSDTAHHDWQPPPQRPRPRRAYVVTIGVNDYAEPRLKLDFAVPDADLIGQRLASLPGYEVRRITLTSTPRRPVLADQISAALLILAGADPGPERETLRAGGHDAAQLAEATPDDVVIISFSGHGFAQPSGSFALLASDVRWGALDAAPDPDSVIPAEELTMLLRAIKAGEIAFIIDACHSGAAVETPDFKPGPMGDPGLGQLAFDKGLRILAATQGDDVAIENPNLAHGLLSAALGEGLTPSGGPADRDRDGRVLLNEWLEYAVARLPSLEEEVRRGGGPIITRGVRLVLRSRDEPPRSQLPSLFDFTGTPSPVVLRGRP